MVASVRCACRYAEFRRVRTRVIARSFLVRAQGRLERGDRGWKRGHIVLMGGSFIALLTGFYVDNGPHLPFWQHLPRWTFWILPTALGIPLIC